MAHPEGSEKSRASLTLHALAITATSRHTLSPRAGRAWDSRTQAAMHAKRVSKPSPRRHASRARSSRRNAAHVSVLDESALAARRLLAPPRRTASARVAPRRRCAARRAHDVGGGGESKRRERRTFSTTATSSSATTATRSTCWNARTSRCRAGADRGGDLLHICVAGESNAGKSSLLNHLLRKKNLGASSVGGRRGRST